MIEAEDKVMNKKNLLILMAMAALVIIVVVITTIKPDSQAKEEKFSSNDDIYMYCLENWDNLGVLPSVAISSGVKTPDEIIEISCSLGEAPNKNIFTDQLTALDLYDTYYMSIRESKLYNWDYQMFISIAESKKQEAKKTIEDAKTLETVLQQYDTEIQVYTACLN